MPLWKLYRTTYLKRFDEASENLYRTSDKLIKDAIKKAWICVKNLEIDLLKWHDLRSQKSSVSDPDPQGSASFGRIRI